MEETNEPFVRLISILFHNRFPGDPKTLEEMEEENESNSDSSSSLSSRSVFWDHGKEFTSK